MTSKATTAYSRRNRVYLIDLTLDTVEMMGFTIYWERPDGNHKVSTILLSKDDGTSIIVRAKTPT